MSVVRRWHTCAWVLACACACAWGDWSRRLEPVSGPRAFGRRLLNETGLRRVINGERAKVGDVPYLVSFRHTARPGRLAVYRAFCGGSLLSASKALSAAHCFETFAGVCSRGHVKRNELKRVRAITGSVNNVETLERPVDPESTQFSALRNVWYPSSYKFPSNDIAVVTLVKPFMLTEYVKPISHATKFANYAGTCLAAGFGRVHYDVTTPTRYMYMANLEILPDKTCSNYMRKSMKKFVCTDTKRNDVAQGDSGGPLVCMGAARKEGPLGTLVGATSAGITQRSGRRLTLFTRVSSHLKFIRKSRAPPSPCPVTLLPTAVALVLLAL